ncbi:Formate dehydrogenase chain D [Rhodovulum sp. P5]|nr:formate dehydrogenase accessory sulfurtransferase FdhD [Rhodovulum sp. P5]ARE41646.1 Formate dehydrogenase chain D [Rhodovulum sp. P5]
MAKALTVGPHGSTDKAGPLAEEVPVALCFDGTTQAVMLASPTDLADFAVGFALSEGIVQTPDAIEGFERVDHDTGLELRIWLSPGHAARLTDRRRLMAGPVGCGLCGIDSLAAAARPLPKVSRAPMRLSADHIAQSVRDLSRAQPMHAATHATHAAGFWTPAEGLVAAREDVGRHNALDKLIGALARAGRTMRDGAIVMTSRVSIELVQKAAMAGAPVLIAVSAPTARAVSAAEEAGLALIARARPPAFEVFTHPDRIALLELQDDA